MELEIGGFTAQLFAPGKGSKCPRSPQSRVQPQGPSQQVTGTGEGGEVPVGTSSGWHVPSE